MKSLPVIQPARATGAPADTGPLRTAGMTNDQERSAALMPEIVKALSRVFDPEIPVNVYDLGLVYDVIVDASSHVGSGMSGRAVPAATGGAGGRGRFRRRRRHRRRRLGSALDEGSHVGRSEAAAGHVLGGT